MFLDYSEGPRTSLQASLAEFGFEPSLINGRWQHWPSMTRSAVEMVSALVAVDDKGLVWINLDPPDTSSGRFPQGLQLVTRATCQMLIDFEVTAPAALPGIENPTPLQTELWHLGFVPQGLVFKALAGHGLDSATFGQSVWDDRGLLWNSESSVPWPKAITVLKPDRVNRHL